MTVLGTPWLYVVMAREGLFFASFARCSSRDAPTRALLLQWTLSVIYLVSAELHFLVDAVVFCEWIFHGLVAWGLLRFRRRNPTAPRPFRSPLYPLAPLLYLLAAVLAVGNQLHKSHAGAAALGLTVVALGVLAFAAWTRFDGRPR